MYYYVVVTCDAPPEPREAVCGVAVGAPLLGASPTARLAHLYDSHL